MAEDWTRRGSVRRQAVIVHFFEAVERGDPLAVAGLVLLAALWVLLGWRFCRVLEKGLGGE